MPREGALFILVGPSGAGKNTLMKQVQQDFNDLQQLATMTTREIRAGEVNGREHWFVSHQEFQRLIKEGALLEYQQVHMNDYYGTPRQTVEDAVNQDRDLIADVEFLGAGNIYEAFPAHTVLIFLTPSRFDTLEKRIRQRGNISDEELKNRLQRAKFEMIFAPQCHYMVLNDDIRPAVAHLRRIIASERARRRGVPLNGIPQETHHTIRGTVTALIQQQDRLLVRAGNTAPPTFSIDDPTVLPHKALKTQLERALNCPVHIGVISDSRFDFVAPDHVIVASPPPIARLDYYYRCTLDLPAVLGWEWRSISELSLPLPLDDRVMRL